MRIKLFNKELLPYSLLKDYVLKKIDPSLLLFLLFMLNYRISFKLIALVGIYIYRPNFKIKRDGIFFFYLFMILLSLLSVFFRNDFSYNHMIVVISGSLIWLACLLSYHQINLWLASSSAFQITNSLKVLVAINFIVSIVDILKIMIINQTLNPYTQIVGPPYGISSGDLIGGVFGGLHLVNTVLCSFLIVFFIDKKHFFYVLLCLVPFLLTGSNLGAIILTGMLIYITIFNKEMLAKYFAIFSITIISLFYIKITPQNTVYMVKTIDKVRNQLMVKSTANETVNNKGKQDSQLTEIANQTPKKQTKEELINRFIWYKQRLIANDSVSEIGKEQKIKILNLITAFENKEKRSFEKATDMVFHKKDSIKIVKNNSSFFEYGNLKKFDLDAEPGKLTSFKQTRDFLKSDLKTALFGGGVGSFSSRLAFITSKIVDDSRIMEMIPKYETKDFRENHKAIFKYLLFLDDETHSITNLPFCWYNQVLGEYGLIGFALFLIFYLYFFIRKFPDSLSYGRIILILLLGFFFFDYWYERLSVVILFELIMLLNIKELIEKNRR